MARVRSIVAITIAAMAGTHGGCSRTHLVQWTAGDRGAPLRTSTPREVTALPTHLRAFFHQPPEWPIRADGRLSKHRARLTIREVRRLTSTDQPSHEANLHWSADGYYLAYEVTSLEGRRIHVQDLPGDYARDLAITPNNESDLRVAALESNSSSRAIVNDGMSFNTGLRWSHDSTRYAFASNGGVGEFNIYIGAVGIDEYPVAYSTARSGSPVWSRVSPEIAFVSARSGHGDVYTYHVDQRSLSTVSRTEAPDSFPEWFPNGLGIVFSSVDAQGHDLYLALRTAYDSTSWGEPQRLVGWDGDELRPTVSPNGRWIAFFAKPRPSDPENGSWNLHVISAAALDSAQLESPETTLVARGVILDLSSGPAWAPDSSAVLFVRDDPASTQPIAAYDLATARAYDLPTHTKINRDVMVSPHGVLSFRSQVGAWDRIFVASIDAAN